MSKWFIDEIVGKAQGMQYSATRMISTRINQSKKTPLLDTNNGVVVPIGEQTIRYLSHNPSPWTYQIIIFI